MNLSPSATHIIHTLNNAGFEAFAVGGCIRDMLRGITPDDIDITTNALPSQILQVFSNERVIPTGLQHGTVTVLIENEPFEITTYRTDGTYSDGRHPDTVAFTASLSEDLARRDFTINAMAYHPVIGIVDPFDGKADLKKRLLRCVGDPAKRFDEDALRIARLVRFMCTLDFDCDPATAQAAHDAVGNLDMVAAERKRVELMKCLMGDGFLRVSEEFHDVLCRIVPILTPLYGFEQHNLHHSFDVYTHTMRAVHAAEKDPLVRLAALFHDVGKPDTFFKDEHGIGHFYGHPAVSEQLAAQAMHALRFDNATIQAVLPLLRHHDSPILDNRRQIKRYLSKLGRETFERLLLVKQADAAACHLDSVPPDFAFVHAWIEDILAANECLTLRDLAIGGNDLIALGIPAGPSIGILLNRLLEAVIDERCQNDRLSLLALAKELYHDV